MKLTKPKPIKEGDTAIVVSPSAGIMLFAKERVSRAKSNLEKLGLKVEFAPNAKKNNGYTSATIDERISDIHYAFSDKNCSLVIASIGGNHSNQLITKLDYDLIRQNPKSFVGYSDNTVLHLALLSQANLQTYYGPCFMNQFGEYPEVLDYTVKDFKKVAIDKEYRRNIKPSNQYTDEILDWFKNEDASRPRKREGNRGFEWWKDGSCQGWALPVAIPSINHVMPTKYMPDVMGAVLMIDIPEGSSMHEGLSVAEVDSWITDLLNAGVLNSVTGIVIGRPYKYSEEMINQLRNVLTKLTSNLNMPILFNADFGHTDPMITIPYGSKVSLNAKTNTLKFN